MKKIVLLALSLSTILTMLAQQKPAYVLYNAKGKKVSYKKMIRSIKQEDIVLFGEFHNNPISHWLQLEITKDCHQYRDLVLGADRKSVV